MPGKTKINGTTYTVKGGKARVNGTVYAVKSGKARVNGTAYSVSFISDPVANGAFELTYQGGTDWKQLTVPFVVGMTFGGFIDSSFGGGFYAIRDTVYCWNDLPVTGPNGQVQKDEEIANGEMYYAV